MDTLLKTLALPKHEYFLFLFHFHMKPFLVNLHFMVAPIFYCSLLLITFTNSFIYFIYTTLLIPSAVKYSCSVFIL